MYILFELIFSFLNKYVSKALFFKIPETERNSIIIRIIMIIIMKDLKFLETILSVLLVLG